MPKQRVPLTTRIYSGFTAVGSITLALVIISFIGLEQLKREFTQISAFSESLEAGIALGKVATAMQASAEFFVETGQTAAAEQVRQHYQTALKNIDILESSSLLQDKTNLARVKRHLTSFRNTFDQVQNQRFKRSLVVEETLPSITNTWGDLVSGYQTQTITAWSLATSNSIWRELLMVEKNMSKYFDTLDYRYAAKVDELFHTTYESLNSLIVLESYEPQIKQLNAINSSMIEGEKAFNEAVQRVRGYLFLVNVVLAADSYEMRFLSDQLAQQMQQSVNQSQASSLSTIEALNLKLLILGMLFLGATIVISYIVGRSIVHPIAYLRHIFERLAKGERDLTVVEYRTKDEVAALARSAEAFRRTNVHTQELLDKYQELSAELEDKVEARTAELEQANKRLAELSITDGLTGLFNRRHLDTTLAKNWAMARRSKLPLTVIMTDIDYFKKYNDLYGHQQGDSCLQEIARTMQEVFSRSTDFVARYGGEEFVVVLMDTHLNEAKQLAEELRERIEAHNIEHKDSPEGHVTLSIGLASFEPDCDIDNVDRLVGLADDALYQSKESGRNRVSVIGVELK